jgi:hypothetical protein
VRIGRQALDEEVREALSHTHPDISFDWNALDREHEAMRSHQLRERMPGPDRRGGGDRPRQPAKVVLEDHSPLGRVLGADRARALRTLYGELVQRIQRRARTPEDRERLLERAQRLNPDDWQDEAVIRPLAEGFEAERMAIQAELPSRRRGRRGGRHRDGEAAGRETAPGESQEFEAGLEPGGDDGSEWEEAQDPAASAIMAGEGEDDSNARTDSTDVAPSAAAADDRRVDHPAGAGGTDQPAAGDGLPRDSELRDD